MLNKVLEESGFVGGFVSKLEGGQRLKQLNANGFVELTLIRVSLDLGDSY